MNLWYEQLVHLRAVELEKEMTEHRRVRRDRAVHRWHRVSRWAERRAEKLRDR